MEKDLFTEIKSLARGFASAISVGALCLNIISCSKGGTHSNKAVGNAILPSAGKLPPPVVGSVIPVLTDPTNNSGLISGSCVEDAGAVVHLSGDDSQLANCSNNSFSFIVTKANPGTYNFTLFESSLTLHPSDPVSVSWVKASSPTPTPTPTVAALTLAPSTATIVAGTTQQFTASGGLAPYTFATTGVCGSIDGNGLLTAASSSGTCSVTVTDSNNLVATAAVTINPAVAISPAVTMVMASGTATFSASGGLAPYSFSKTSGVGSINSSTGVFTAPASSGSTVVAVHDSLGNVASATITTTTQTIISPAAVTTVVGNQVQFTASNGLAPYTYVAQTGCGTVDSSGLLSAGSNAGTCTVTVTDANNYSATATVTINSAPLVISPSLVTLMAGHTATFTATGGVGSLTLSVSSGAGTIDSASGVFTAGASAGTSVVTVTDGSGNTAFGTITVLTQTLITPATVSTLINGQVQFSASNGLAPYTYSTASGCGSIDAAGLFTAPSSSGTCSVTVTDSNGIAASSTVTINPLPLSLSPGPLSMSVNGLQLFSASGGLPPYTYSINSGSGVIDSSSGLFTAAAVPGTVEVKVADSAGTSVLSTVTVVGVLNIVASHPIIALNNTATFTATGGFGGNVFSVVSGAGTIDAVTGVFTPSAIGTISVKVTDSSGANTSTSISVVDLLAISPSSTTVALSQTLQFAALHGVPPYSYALNSGAGSVNRSCLYTASTATGTGVVRVTDALGNTSDANVTVTNALLLSPQTVTLAVNNQVQMTTFGGTPNYTYSVLSGTGTITGAGLFTAGATDGTTVLKVRDSNNNISTATVTVNPALSITPLTIQIVAGANATFAGVDGVPSYTYSILSGGGSIDSSTGVFTAPATASTVSIQVMDSMNNTFTATANTYDPLVISPITLTPVQVGGSYNFTTIGGYGAIAFSASNGTVDANGLYVAPLTGTTDRVTATDSLGNTSAVDIALYQPITITPTSTNAQVSTNVQFTASGGYGSITYSTNGGSINSTSGLLSAPNSAQTVKVTATDSLNNTATGSVLVYLGLTLSPSTAVLTTNRGLQFSALGGQAPFTYAIQSGSGTINSPSAGYYRAPSTASNVVVEVTDGLNNVATASVSVLAVTKLVSAQQGQHNCAIFTGGLLKCWGLNSSGQLGLGNTANRGSATGTTNGMGDNLPFVNLGNGVTVKDIALGSTHTCAILGDDSVKCWGSNSSGQLGTGTSTTIAYGKGTATTSCSSTTLCSAAAAPAVNLGGKTAKSIYVGATHTCAILNDDSTLCWGNNSSGQLGVNSTTNYGTTNGAAMASPLAYNTGEFATSLALGDAHTCALLNTGYVRCWGANSQGQLGLDNTKTYGNGTSTSASCTSCKMSVLLGLASATNGATNNGTINLGSGNTVTKLVAGRQFNCALLNDGTVKCWGNNTSGQLGQNNTNTYGGSTSTQSGCNPCSITFLTALTPASLGDSTVGASITDLTAGYLNPGTATHQVCLLLSTNKLKCIGGNKYGQLAIASSTTATTMLTIGSTSTAAANGKTAAPINSSWTTAAPFFNNFGNISTSLTPSKIVGGGASFCSLFTNNEVKCWGYGGSGQLGYESTTTTGLGLKSSELGDSLLPVVFAGAR